jgi:hypothetical protein
MKAAALLLKAMKSRTAADNCEQLQISTDHEAADHRTWAVSTAGGVAQREEGLSDQPEILLVDE